MQSPNDQDDKLKDLPLQSAGAGTGPLYHRRYHTRFASGGRKAQDVLKTLMADPNQFSPQIMASFEKTKGEAHTIAIGDHFMVHITGPWNGPVEVSQVDDHSFTLQTLEGHMEAGRIRFAVTDVEPDQMQFEIESWARSHTPVVDFLYDKIPLARAAQTTMWVSFCKAIAKFAGTDETGPPPVEVETEKWDGTRWTKL